MDEIDLNIRIADDADAELLSALATTTFYEAYFALDDSGDLGAYCVAAFNLKQMRDELKNTDSMFFIAEFQGKAVGYAKLRENSTAAGVEHENAVEIQRIYILEKAKGKKAGFALMTKCFAVAKEKGFEKIWLGVWRYNLPAQKFYENFDFQKVGELDFPYGDGVEINYVLARKL